MTMETLLWVIGANFASILGWAIYVTTTLSKIREATTRSLDILQDPESNGLGTGSMSKIIEDNTHAMKSLTHYIRWFVETSTGKEPPPPLD